jgi:hypothetical protein
MSESLEQPRFGWLDGFILVVFAACGLVMAVLNDRVFFNLLPSLASHQAPWQSLPDWVADLELPAKRVQWDFRAFLSVVSMGLGLVIVRGRRCGFRNGLPGPGVAAGITAAAVVIEQTLERLRLAAQDGSLVWPVWLRVRYDGHVWNPGQWNTGPYWYEVEAAVTAAILGVWSYLVLARAWKPRDDWRDWLGRWRICSLGCFRFRRPRHQEIPGESLAPSDDA